jgi:hypothetical protein
LGYTCKFKTWLKVINTLAYSDNASSRMTGKSFITLTDRWVLKIADFGLQVSNDNLLFDVMSEGVTQIFTP